MDRELTRHLPPESWTTYRSSSTLADAVGAKPGAGIPRFPHAAPSGHEMDTVGRMVLTRTTSHSNSRVHLPNEGQTVTEQHPYPYQPQMAPAAPAPRNGLGTAGFVLGLIGLIFSPIPFIGVVAW